MKPISPYIFPGIQGTMSRPYPSAYPLPADVLRACCNVFDKYGRGCDVYRSHRVQCLPEITPELVLRTKERNPLLYDLMKLFCYITSEHARWKSSSRSEPHKYTNVFIADILNVSRPNVTAMVTKAGQMIRYDACFRAIYMHTMKDMLKRYTFDISRECIDEVNRQAA